MWHTLCTEHGCHRITPTRPRRHPREPASRVAPGRGGDRGAGPPSDRALRVRAAKGARRPGIGHRGEHALSAPPQARNPGPARERVARGRSAFEALLPAVVGRRVGPGRGCWSSGTTSMSPSNGSSRRTDRDAGRSIPGRGQGQPAACPTRRHHRGARGQPSVASRGRSGRPRPSADRVRGGRDPQELRQPDGGRRPLSRRRAVGHLRPAVDRPGAVPDLHEGPDHQRRHHPDHRGGRSCSSAARSHRRSRASWSRCSSSSRP